MKCPQSIVLSGMHSTQRDPVFADDDSMRRPIDAVPGIVSRMAKSFATSRGTGAGIETHWLYTGSGNGALDTAWFGQTIGVDLADDGLDRIVRGFDHLSTALAVRLPRNELGIQLTFTPAVGDAAMAQVECTFIPDERKLIRDRPLARLLIQPYRSELAAMYGELDRITDEQLATFVLAHRRTERIRYPNAGADGAPSTQLAYLPASLRANVFSTPGSYHPTRSFLQPALAANRYDNGDTIVDGHVHRALTAKRNGGDPWLTQLADRYGGPAKAAAVLSLADSEQFLQIEHWGRRFDRSDLQYAARELFVTDDDANVVAHSVFPMHTVLADDTLFARFVDVLKRCSVSPTNADLRLRYHDMMMELTLQLPLDRSLRLSDYAA